MVFTPDWMTAGRRIPAAQVAVWIEFFGCFHTCCGPDRLSGLFHVTELSDDISFMDVVAFGHMLARSCTFLLPVCCHTPGGDEQIFMMLMMRRIDVPSALQAVFP